MKKIILALVTATALSGCQNLNQLASSLGDLRANFEPLDVDTLCELKITDNATAMRRYSNRQYIFSGSVFVAEKKDNYTVIGINSGGGKVFAKVYNVKNLPVTADKVDIKGKISEANFDEDKKNQCMILLDDGIIVN